MEKFQEWTPSNGAGEMTPSVSSPVSSVYSWKVIRINVWSRSALNIHYWVLWFPTASSSFLMVFNTSLRLLQEIKLWVASKANYLAWVWSRFKMKAFAAPWWSQKVVAGVWFHLIKGSEYRSSTRQQSVWTQSSRTFSMSIVNNYRYLQVHPFRCIGHKHVLSVTDGRKTKTERGPPQLK